MGTNRAVNKLRAWLSEHGGFTACYIAFSCFWVIYARFDSGMSWQRAVFLGAFVAAAPVLAVFAVIASIHLLGTAIGFCSFIARVWRSVWR